jgi:hypothetical protein
LPQIAFNLPQIKRCPGQIELYAGLMQPQPRLLVAEGWRIKVPALRLKRQERRNQAEPPLFSPIIQRLRRSVNRFSPVFSRLAAIF